MKFLMAGLLLVTLQQCNPQYQKLKPVVVSQCPELTQYSLEDLKKAATELRMLPSDSQIAEMIADYSKLRDACRVLSNHMRTYYYKKQQRERQQHEDDWRDRAFNRG